MSIASNIVTSTAKKITSLWDLSGGDHISVPGQSSNDIGIPISFYSHHMIVVEVLGSRKLKVIHFYSHRFGEKAVIREEDFVVDPYCGAVYRIDYVSFVYYCGEEAIERARSRIGEESYDLLLHNCETFCTWVKVGKNISTQARNGIGVGALALGIVGGAGAVAAGAFALVSMGVYHVMCDKKKPSQ